MGSSEVETREARNGSSFDCTTPLTQRGGGGGPFAGYFSSST